MITLSRWSHICLASALLAGQSISQSTSDKNRGKSFYTTDEVRIMCGVRADIADRNRVLALQDSANREYNSQLATSQKLMKTTTVPNWRSLMSSVKNQGLFCKDCWVHAATGATEGQLHILYRSIIGAGLDLDELEIPYACYGGLPSEADSIIRTNTMRCEVGSYPNVQGTKWRITEYAKISGITNIKNALEQGPVTACFFVYEDFAPFFALYPTGVYRFDTSSGYVGAHAVVIVSYNEQYQYWLCKNCWGSDWGDAGYFKIGYGECGIETFENTTVTVNEGCYAKLVPNLITSLSDAADYGFSGNEWAYVLGSASAGATVTTPFGATIQVNTGSTLNFTGNYKLRVEGGLLASGATFTRSGGQWYGIEFYNVYNGSSISGCTIENAQYGVYAYNTYLETPISNNVFRDNSTGIYCSTSWLRFNYNLIESNGYGVNCASYSDPVVEPNNIIRYNGWGVNGDASSSPDLSEFTGVGYNSIYWNDYYDVYSSYAGTIYAHGNWWGDYPPFPALSGNVDYSDALNSDPNGWAKVAVKLGSNSAPVSSPQVSTASLDTLGLAAFAEGQRLFLKGESERAFTSFDQLVKRYPNSLAGTKSLIYLARIQHKLNLPAKPTLTDVANVEPRTSVGKLAKLLLVGELLRESDNVGALTTAESLLDCGDSLLVKHALYNAGNILWYRLGNKAKGESYFRTLAEAFPGDALSISGLAALGERYVDQSRPPKKEESASVPGAFTLHPNHPNPFNPSTTIEYDMPWPAHVSAIVYDVLGRQVTQLANGFQSAGSYSLRWNASGMASGVYLLRLTISDGSGHPLLDKVNKLLLAK